MGWEVSAVRRNGNVLRPVSGFGGKTPPSPPVSPQRRIIEAVLCFVMGWLVGWMFAAAMGIR